MIKGAKIIDDIVQMAGGAAGVLGSVQEQIRNDVKTRVEDIAAQMDLVPREDLERVEARLTKALSNQKDILNRLEKLENSGKGTKKK